ELFALQKRVSGQGSIAAALGECRHELKSITLRPIIEAHNKVSTRVEPIRSVKGTRDLLPPDTSLWQRVEAEAHRVFEAYHYGEIRTPILEETALFARGVGTETDIVMKEM